MPRAEMRLVVAAAALAASVALHVDATQASEQTTHTQAPEHLVTISFGRAKQQFQGFGASQPRDNDRLFTVYGNSRVRQLLRQVYTELGMNWVRLWVGSGEDSDVTRMKRSFYRAYVDNGYLIMLRAAGARRLLLAPTIGEGAPREPMPQYATKLATFIAEIRREQNVVVDVTGIANEPAGFTPQQLSDAVRHLRVALDERGLESVRIISPECASPDACATNAIRDAKNTPDTWNALSGIATHSYNMGANPEVETLILGTGKDYWITEAGRGLPRQGDEQPGETGEASVATARFLNDMNHGVTHWIWFIGIGHFDRHPNNDSGQVLARPDDSSASTKFNTKYFYFKQLHSAFDLGARFHEASSDIEKRMTWGFGQKPAVTASLARNPDNSWAIAAVNTTGNPSHVVASFPLAATLLVRMVLPAEARNARFRFTRSLPNGSEQGASIAATGTTLEFKLAPHELVTLRSFQ